MKSSILASAPPCGFPVINGEMQSRSCQVRIVGNWEVAYGASDCTLGQPVTSERIGHSSAPRYAN
jgi:hypothetical protein